MRRVDLGVHATEARVIGIDAGPRTHVQFPFWSQARALFPRYPSSAAGTSIARYATPRSAAGRLAVRGSSALARLGALRLLPGRRHVGGEGSFMEFLGEMLHVDDLAVAVHLGPPRANRKPVYHVMDGAGRSIAYAKIGVSEFTNQRVKHERWALESLEELSLPGLVVPELIAGGVWGGLEYLVTRPLIVESGVLPSRAMRDVAHESLVEGFGSELGPIASSGWWRRSLDMLDAFHSSSDSLALAAASECFAERYGDVLTRAGAQHGDWSSWNMGVSSRGLAVWDWERFAVDTPVEWDELHYWIGAHRGGVAHAISGTSQLLREVFPDTPGRDSRALLAGYLVYRGIAYVVDRQEQAGAETGPLDDWLLPALHELIE